MSIANASEVVCDPDNPKHCSTGLSEGQEAPFTGELLTPDLALFLGSEAEDCPERIRIEVDKTVDLMQVELSLEKNLRRIDKETHHARTKYMAQEIKKRSRWWMQPELWFGVGIVLGVGATVGAYHLASKHIQTIQ